MEKYNLVEFGMRVKEVRVKRGYSMKRLNKESNIALNTIRSIERATNLPSTPVLVILSDTLNYDLINLLNECKYEWTRDLELFKEELNDIFNKRDYSTIPLLINNIEIYIEEHSIRNQSVLNQFNQFKGWIEGLLFAKHDLDYTKALDTYFSALKITLPDVNKDNYEKWEYSTQELEVLNSIASAYIGKNDYNTCEKIYVLIQQKSTNDYNLFLKSCLNLSSCYFQVKDYLGSIEQALKGIDFNRKHNLSNDFSFFYYCLGRAEYKLGIESYKKSLKTAVFFYELDFPNKPNKIKTLINKYGYDKEIPI